MDHGRSGRTIVSNRAAGKHFTPTWLTAHAWEWYPRLAVTNRSVGNKVNTCTGRCLEPGLPSWQRFSRSLRGSEIAVEVGWPEGTGAGRNPWIFRGLYGGVAATLNARRWDRWRCPFKPKVPAGIGKISRSSGSSLPHFGLPHFEPGRLGRRGPCSSSQKSGKPRISYAPKGSGRSGAMSGRWSRYSW